MKHKAIIGIATKSLLLAGLIAAGLILAQSKDSDEEAKRSARAEETAKSLRQGIQNEIKKLGNHEWAGAYYEGDGLGVNVSLLIAPNAGYVFEWHGCLGLYDRNYGSVITTNGKLHLSFTFENDRKGFQGIASEFIPVHWGKRTYLIPADDMIGFCNAVNSREEPREGVHGRYLLRDGDEKLKVAGDPLLPAGYRAYLLKSPVHAEIIRIGSYTTRPSVCEWKFKDSPVTLNAGKESGLLPGMELSVTAPDSVVESVKIKSVGEHQSEGVMTQIGEESVGPKMGWKLSTLPGWRKKPGE